MGQRGRRRAGLDAAAAGLRSHARRVARDSEASDIARTVYNIAVELKGDEGADALPLPILAPLVAAAERSAPGAAKMAGINYRDEAILQDVAAYLVAGFREMVVGVNVEHFRAWCEETDEAEAALSSAPTSTTEEGSTEDDDGYGSGDRSADDGTRAEPRATDGSTEARERHPDGESEAEATDEGGDARAE